MTDRLSRAQLMERAVKATGLEDFGDIPFHDALDVLLHSLERDAQLDDARRAGAAQMVVGTLAKRLTLTADRRAFPGIAQEQVKAPIFIVGLPRTGSTNLHGLMSRIEGVRAPRRWEMSRPSPPPQAASYETDPRIAEVHAAEVANAPEALKKRHTMAADIPEQCQSLNDYAFMNWALLAPYDIPTYRDWMLNADHRASYEAHKRTLQHLQHRHPGPWVLKYPKHILTLDALIAVYPDARLIWTHREPAQIIPSVVSLIGFFRSATPGYDPKRLGREWAAFEELGLRRGLDARDALFRPENVYDMRYSDVMRDPVEAIAAACDHFGMGLSGVSADAIRAHRAANAKDRQGAHDYAAEEYGLDEAVLRSTYRPYAERFGLA
ncbi:MAG: hypothetical protein JWQ29_2906 [Phenylobacterium sp.]|nr:hypothetical protein [Phenylobacterium sp.]